MNNESPQSSHDIFDTRILVAIGGIAFIFLLLILVSLNRNNHQRIDEIRPAIVQTHDKNTSFDGLTLGAKAAIVWDVRRNVPIYTHNSEQSLPLASLTKILTAVAALESVPEYTVVPIEADALAQEGDTGLKLHERWGIRELIELSLVSSSNDGARAIASAVGSILGGLQASSISPAATSEDIFVQKMNDLSQTIGLKHLAVKNEHGLDISKTESGAYGSAEDVARLITYAWKEYPSVFQATAGSTIATHSNDGLLHTAKNTNPIVDSIPGLMASKTGFTDLAGGNVAVITSPGMEGPFAIVVLGSTYDGRFSDLERLSQATLEYVLKNR